MTIILDRVEDIDLIWPALWTWFDKVRQRTGTDLTPDEILAGARDGRLTLWAIYKRDEPLPLLGVAATGTIDSDGETVCIIASLAGRDFPTWGGEALAGFEDMARANGVTRLRVEGRPGWARQLRPYGFQVTREYVGEPKRLRAEKRL